MRSRRVLIVLVLVLSNGTDASYNWTQCKENVINIRDHNQTINGVSPANLSNFLYNGTVRGLAKLSQYDNPDYVRITYNGCKIICANPVATYEPAVAISAVANWIFPLAILLNLPYESLHSKKLSGSLLALLNWLGSPQTALTATIFNFRQIRESYRRAYSNPNTERTHLYSAAYFVLTCANQFDELQLIDEQGKPKPMLNLLVYGLFRPLSTSEEPDVELLRQLLLMMAFQLRMLRRRGVIPMLANLAVFLVAFIFSLVLTFAELGSGTGSFSFSLAFGLLMTWLPLLVVFTVVDRNPISSDRSAVLISRYLHTISSILASPHAPKWWDHTPIPPNLTIGPFIGQGRKIQYAGLPHAFLSSTSSIDFTKASKSDLQTYANLTAAKLHGWKPTAWYIVAVTSLLLVWVAVMSAFVISFNSYRGGVQFVLLSDE
ncbi:hypothetical protein OQA88_8730 [Cercophora sp. LCS_1]